MSPSTCCEVGSAVAGEQVGGTRLALPSGSGHCVMFALCQEERAVYIDDEVPPRPLGLPGPKKGTRICQVPPGLIGDRDDAGAAEGNGTATAECFLLLVGGGD